MEIIFGLLALVIGGVGIFILTVGLLSALRGWVLAKLWAWFLVPLGMPVLTIPHAIGLALIVGMLVHVPERGKDDRDTKEKNISLAMALIGPLLSLGMGWVVTRWM